MKLIYKHSPTCRISAKARMEVDSFLAVKQEQIQFEFVNVIEDRERSNIISEKYSIKHKTPQAILIDDDGKVVWDASHYQISERNIMTEFSAVAK